MEDQSKTEQELIKEISDLKQRIKELEQSDSGCKRAENLLRQEHELYLDLVNNQPAGIYRIRVYPRELWQKDAWINPEHPPYSVDLASNRFCEILGINRQVFETNPGIVENLIYPEDKEDFTRRNEEANAELVLFQWEGRLSIRGKILWVHFESIPRLIENGVVLWTGILYDITDRKRAEYALRESEFFFKESQRVAAIGSYKTDFIKGAWESSEVLDTIFGIDKNYNRSVQSWLDIVHPDDSDMMDQYLREEVIAKRKPFSKEYRIIRKNDGETRWVYGLGEVKFDSNGKILSMSGTIQDITERRHADEALRESEDKFRSIFEKATDGILIAEAKTKKFIEANKAMCIMLGYTRDEIVGLSIDDIHPKQDLPAIRESFEKQVRGEISLATEVPMLRKDGSVFYADIKAAPVTLGEKQCLAGIVRDITDQQKLEDQLRQAQKMESIDTLAGGIAHDFNNILAVIVSYGHIVLMKMAKDDPQRVNIEHILEAGERAAQLTKSLLLFSRKQISDRKPLDLNEIIRTVDKFLNRVIGEDVECRTSLFEGALPISGDTHQLEQILMNLVTNARDAMSTGGTCTISTEQARLDEPFITIHGYGKPGVYGVINISDTGKGMDAITREHIFEPFFTTKEVGKGTGLGLSIAYGVIKQHEGFINVYSEPGQGTIFKIYLPLIPAGVEEEKKLVEERPRGGTETILLAEDDETVRIMTTAILETFGYTVIAAVDGQDVVNKYRENKDRIELLLFDMILPKKTGKEAYDEIRAIKPDIKILFQSSYAPDFVKQNLMLEDMMPVVFKPVAPMMLLKQVRSMLDQVK